MTYPAHNLQSESDALFETIRSELGLHLQNIRRYAFSLTRNAAEADDLTHDAVEKALKNYQQFKVGSNFKYWMFRIVKNSFIDQIRKKKRQGISIEFDPETMGDSVPASQTSTLDLEHFQNALETLGQEDQQLLIWIGYDGLAYQEIAEKIGVPTGTVKSKLNRARHKLKEACAS